MKFRKAIIVLLACVALPLRLWAETEDPSGATFVSLDGKAVLAGNPLENVPDAHLIKEVKDPVLWLFRSQVAAPQGTVLLCPGGGYRCLEMRNEGVNTARFLNQQGFDVAILEYRIAAPQIPDPKELALADAVKSFRLLKSSASSLGIHDGRLAIMGYSAGGHLAARTVENLGENDQPDGLILVYPAYLEKTIPGKATPAVVPPPKPRRLLAVIAANDNPNWVKSCQEYSEAWKKSGGDSIFHLLSDGGHGYGIAANSDNSNQHWPDLLKAFLQTKSGPAINPVSPTR